MNTATAADTQPKVIRTKVGKTESDSLIAVHTQADLDEAALKFHWHRRKPGEGDSGLIPMECDLKLVGDKPGKWKSEGAVEIDGESYSLVILRRPPKGDKDGGLDGDFRKRDLLEHRPSRGSGRPPTMGGPMGVWESDDDPPPKPEFP